MIEEVVELAQTARSSRCFERAVLERLQAAVGFDVGFFSVRGAEAEPTATGLDQGLIELAVARAELYAAELEPIKRAALAARGVAVDTAVLGEAQVRKLHYYRELAARVKGRHSLFACLTWRGQMIGLVMLGRCGSAFTAQDRERVEELVPALGATRAAFGLTFQPKALAPAARRGPWARWLGERQVLAQVRTELGLLQVRDRAGFREMVASERGSDLIWTRAALADPRVSGWPYVDLFHVAAARAARRERALFIGAGGGVALQQFASVYPGIALDLVERDARVIELARDWFALDALPRLTVTLDDGARFVARAQPNTWDVAIIDAFDATSASQPLLEAPFLSSLCRALRPGGALALNFIGNLDAPELASLARRIERCFQGVQLLPVVAGGELEPGLPRNVVLVAIRSP